MSERRLEGVVREIKASYARAQKAGLWQVAWTYRRVLGMLYRVDDPPEACEAIEAARHALVDSDRNPEQEFDR